MGNRFKCPDWDNPADFFMDMLSIESLNTYDSIEPSKTKTTEEVQLDYRKHIDFLWRNYENSKLKNDYQLRSNEVTPINEREFTRTTASWFE